MATDGSSVDSAGKRRNLKNKIAGGNPLVVPGTGDAFGARLIEAAGFDAVYMSGFAVEGSFGFPDIGLLSMSEIADRAADIAAASALPLICDCDTGYGGITNVMRTVRTFERAGAAVIQFEDQQLPKKCGSMSGKKIVSTNEMVDRIRAAVDTRLDENLLVIGRTDAVASEGIERATERLQAYAEAGADLLMALGPYSVDEVAKLAQSCSRPFVYLNSESGSMPMISVGKLAEIGIKIAIFPLSLLLSAAHAMRMTLDHIRKNGSTADLIASNMVSYAQFHEIVDLAKYQEFESRHAQGK